MALGPVATPVLYFSTFHLGLDGGIAITGSHNSAAFNGFKIMLGGRPLRADEIQQIARMSHYQDFMTGAGWTRPVSVTSSYLDRIIQDAPRPLGFQVVVDSAHGMAGPLAGELLRRLGCKVVELHAEPDGRFPNHPPDPTVPAHLEKLITAVVENGALVGLAFDGDADRLAAVDGTGRIITGEDLLLLFARQVALAKPGAAIVADVTATRKLEGCIAQWGGTIVRSRTGRNMIHPKMDEVGATLGGESSGHFFFRDRYYGFDDAMYAANRLLCLLAQTEKTPQRLLAELPQSFMSPIIRIHCPDSAKWDALETIRKQFGAEMKAIVGIDGVEFERKGGWGIIRVSNTEPALVLRFEADSKETLELLQHAVQPMVQEIASRYTTVQSKEMT